MKRILLLALFAVGVSAQNLSLTGNTTLGTNCGQGQPVQTMTYQDVNLNGYNLDLRNVRLQVLNNLNGSGSITSCGNPNQSNSSVCVSGNIQNNPNLNGLSCNLSSEKFTFTSEKYYGYNFKVYSVEGKIIQEGTTNQTTYENLPKNQIILVKVEGFTALKIYKNE
jgi:hypothetical protein